MINLNTRPYFDDFNEDNKFYRILFRPGIAVQARELTQLQTILQNQIQRHGDHMFKDGAMVVPGQMSIDSKADFVRLQPTSQGTSIEEFLDTFNDATIVGANGVIAQVVKVVKSENTDPPTLYVRYTSSGTDSTTKVFAPGETITNSAGFVVTAAATDATGQGTIASIQRGVYYVRGAFVLVDEQSILVEKYSNIPTNRIGLEVVERLITPDDEGFDMLLDNAQGSFNFAAPGAHRYFIDLNLAKRSVDTVDDENFIELLRVDSGQIQRHVTKTEYSEIEKTLARRTFDESGNYTVRNFTIDIREHRSNDRSAWAPSRTYQLNDVVQSNGNSYVARSSGTSLAIAPSHTAGTAFDGPGASGVRWEYNESPKYNRGIYSPERGGDSNKIAVGLEPGKAYVEGYEIEKIATEYIDVHKSRDFVSVDNAIIPATVGNFVFVNNTNNLPPIHTFDTISLRDQLTGSSSRGVGVGAVVGTARVRFYEWHSGTIGQTTAVYKLGLFDVKMVDGKSFDRDVKSFHYDVVGNAAQSYTSDVEPRYFRLVGSASAAGTTITGSGTSFQTDVRVGDFVRLGTEVRRVVTVPSQTQITVAGAVTVTGVTIDLIFTRIDEPGNTPLLFNFPYYAIKTKRSVGGTNDTTYSVYDRFVATSSVVSGGVSSLSISTTSGQFASAADPDNYIVVSNTTGAVIVPNNIIVDGPTATIVLDGALASTTCIIIAAINKSGPTLTEKSKTLATTTVVFNTVGTATKPIISLGKADIFRVVSVKMDSGSFATPSGAFNIDIDDRYDVDDGQRSTHYGVGRLQLKSSFMPPTAPVQVTFEFFTHSAGDYFSVNSYPSTVDYADIPEFDGAYLRDSIDFRPRISDDGTGFSGVGSEPALVPKRGIDIRTDFEYYLSRKTKIAVDFNGVFASIDGVSSLNPGDPITPSSGMVLYDLTLEPYTFDVGGESIIVNTHDNRRYTMRDIGRLEKRIDNLEYYTSLSLLEQQTETLDVIDASGETRFKNGFIVDNFSGHNTGDTTSEDYLCSIDMENGELRPFFSMQNVNMLEKNSTAAQRAAGNYQLYGDVITLPVEDHIPIVTQSYASRIENINPFAIFTFLGNVELTPATDDWFEVDRRPDLVVEVEGNFNTLKNLSEKAGVLGTVWNSWQTQWTGAPTQTGSRSQRIVDRSRPHASVGGPGSGWIRNIRVATLATQVGQARTGVRSTIVAKIDRQVVADRVLSTAAIPYIRSRNVLVQCRGLKPGTRFFPFFDNVDISRYCTPASKLVYTITSGQFDSATNVGGLSSEATRRIDGDSQVCLSRGDVVIGQTSGASAVVIGTEFNPDTNTHALHVANVKGSFVANENIVGSVSEALGKFVSVQTHSIADALVTNFSGDLALLFNIPNTDAVRFRTGIREFKLVDTPEAEGLFTSRGRQMYHAQGVLETRQQTVNAVRNGQIVEEQVTDNRVIVQSSTRIVADTGWFDPLAQTFLIEQPGGAFLTKVDIFFATKDTKIPVNLDIREVVNGYPGKVILPFSKVSLKSEEVNISGNTVPLDGVQVPGFDTPTTFTFPSPVYVQHNAEYAIVLSSDSNNYRCWISQVGDSVPGTSRTISEQPYQGVFFKSQNASTWTADQMQDLMFTIYRAKFATDTIANIEFVNDSVPQQRLEFDPFELAVNVNKIRVYQRDHGMPAGSRVVLSNTNDQTVSGSVITGSISTTSQSIVVTGVNTLFTTELRVGSGLFNTAGQFIGQVSEIINNTALQLTSNASFVLTTQPARATLPIGGVPVAEIYTQHTISDIELDSYCITVTTPALDDGYFGGTTVRATRNLQFDAVQPSVQLLSFPETSSSFGMRTTSGQSVDGAQAPYIQDTSFQSILANENNAFFTPRMVASDINEDASLSGAKSLTFNVVMSTTVDTLSPILDTQRTSVIAVHNKVNSPTEQEVNVAGLDDSILIQDNNQVSFVGSTVVSSDPDPRTALATASVGKFLTISGTTGGLNNGTFLVTGVSVTLSQTSVEVAHNFTTQPIGAVVTVIQREFFVDEIAPVGSSTHSKYVTRRINMAASSTFIRARYAANIPNGSTVELYYKTAPVGSTAPFEDLPYKLMPLDAPIVLAQNGSNEFFEIGCSSGDLLPFDAIQVKLVMKSTNSSAVPRIRDLRIVSCA